MNIYKYQLQSINEQFISMPIGAKILTVQVQKECPCLWALVDTNIAKGVKRIAIIGTGHDFDHDSSWVYIGTFQLNNGNLVFHVFEITNK